jgi:hypothetical protein
MWLLVAAATSEAQQQPYGESTGAPGQTSFAPVPAFRSQQSYLDVLAGVAYSDNVTMSPGEKVGDTLGVVGLDVDYTRHGNLDLDVRGVVDWVDYLKHTYPGTAFGTLNGTAMWGQSTDTLQWLAADTFGQAALNPFAAQVPTNIENINYATTGPYLNFALDARDRLSLNALYSNLTYEKSPETSNIYSGGAQLSHLLSSASSIALVANARYTELSGEGSFTEASTDTYNIHSAYLQYTSAIARTKLSASVGYTSLDFGSDKTSTPYLSMQLDRRISYDSTVYLRASNGYSNTGQSLQDNFGSTSSEVSGPTGESLAVATQNPFKESVGALGYRFDRDRTEFSLTASTIAQRYEAVTRFNQNEYVLSSELERHLSPTMSANISAQVNRVHFESEDAGFTDVMASAGVTKHFRRTSLIIRYDRYQRAGNGSLPPAVQTSTPGPAGEPPLVSLNDNRIGVYVSYDVLGHKQRL